VRDNQIRLTSFVHRFSAETILDFTRELFTAVGCTAKTAQTAAEVVLEADLRGVGIQGVEHLPTLLRNIERGIIRPDGVPRIARRWPSGALVDGGSGVGQVAGVFAADLASEIAAEQGCAAVGITNSSDIYMLGYYADRIASRGQVAIAFTSGPPKVHVQGGIDPLLGTNPIAIGIPTADGFNLVADLATSELSFSRVLQALDASAPLPIGSALDADGQPTTDARAAIAGALSPLGGHKGYALGLSVGLLAGPLVVSAVGHDLAGWLADGVKPGPKGHFFLAVNPNVFWEDVAEFPRAVSRHLSEVRESRKAGGVDAIRIPGEDEHYERARRLREGIPIADHVWHDLDPYVSNLGVLLPRPLPH
jgi:LDH2 family malate/lactate/ureidoglycolate dehydrogenase